MMSRTAAFHIVLGTDGDRRQLRLRARKHAPTPRETPSPDGHVSRAPCRSSTITVLSSPEPDCRPRSAARGEPAGRRCDQSAFSRPLPSPTKSPNSRPAIFPCSQATSGSEMSIWLLHPSFVKQVTLLLRPNALDFWCWETQATTTSRNPWKSQDNSASSGSRERQLPAPSSSRTPRRSG